MRGRVVPLVVCVFAVGLAVGWIGKGERGVSRSAGQPGALVVGTPITVQRPTGETVPGPDGPMPAVETTRLVVYRLQGEDTHRPPPGGRVPWRFIIGEGDGAITLFAAPE